MQHFHENLQSKQTEFLNKVVENSLKKQEEKIEHIPIFEKSDQEIEKKNENIAPFTESEIKKSEENEEENDVVLISSNYVLKEDQN